MATISNAITPIAMLLLIIGGGGVFKQVIIDGGVGDTISKIFHGTEMSPIILAWLATAILRLALGSSTVSALSSVGIVLPLIQSMDVNISLIVLAIGAGSVFFSHVNDAGFWMFKRILWLNYERNIFNLDVARISIILIRIRIYFDFRCCDLIRTDLKG